MNPSLPKTSAHTLATPAKRLLIKATTNSATNPAKIPCNGTPADLGTNHPSPLHHPECDCDLNPGPPGTVRGYLAEFRSGAKLPGSVSTVNPIPR